MKFWISFSELYNAVETLNRSTPQIGGWVFEALPVVDYDLIAEAVDRAFENFKP